MTQPMQLIECYSVTKYNEQWSIAKHEPTRLSNFFCEEAVTVANNALTSVESVSSGGLAPPWKQAH
jgi:hypothetical protein